MKSSKKPNRQQTLTRRVESAFGSIYVHSNYDAKGEWIGVRFSTPGKHHEKGLHDLLEGIGDALNLNWKDIKGED